MTPMNPLTMKIGRKHYPISSYKEASEMFCTARDAAGTGASNTPTPLLFEGETVVGYVSYNGRVWPGHPKRWKPGATPLYDNGTGLR